MDNRLSEMALEIFGAKMSHEFVLEVWKSAAPEFKQELANRIVQQLGSLCGKEYHWSSEVSQAIKNVVKEYAEKITQEELKNNPRTALVLSSLKTAWDEEVTNAVKSAANTAIREVLSQIRWPSK